MNFMAKRAQKVFLDTLKIKVRGGTGGHGMPQYGGIGGRGGDVYIQGTSSAITLASVKKLSPDGLFKANDGHPSKRTRLLGKPGSDLIIKVPVGVTVEGLDKQFLGEINKPSDKVIVAMGGRGGDKFNDNQGFVGQSRGIRLDLRTISDAVFVGFPNAGKSSLLRAVSNARPKVASYPFTTLRPHLGTAEFPDFRKITMADLPGLVEGAHKNLGLGHEFLKHIVRSRLLVFLIDINKVDISPTYATRTPLETLCILNKEIELYDDTILNKPAILAISKMDTVENPEEEFRKFTEELKLFQKDPTLVEESIRPNHLLEFDEIIHLSSESRLNIEKFKIVVRNVIDKYAEIHRLKQGEISTFKELQPIENNRLAQ